ncbi:hypothetical protein [Muricoccus radiodurans]|uniref:hypothetical protein n=1 Tax=Muricoccus radiodurans TaxID=2231721 RepID=UPI003CF3C109
MTPNRLASLLAPLAAMVGLAGCVAYDPYYPAATVYTPAPYVAAPAATYAPPPPAYAPSVAAAPYASPMPRYDYIGDAERARRSYGPGYASAATVDPYCREAYAEAAGAERTAAITGRYDDAARAARTDGYYRRDC